MDTWGDLVTSGVPIRGRRIGARPLREAERGERAPRTAVSFWCANRHETRPSFAADAAVPETWECRRCGCPAGQDEHSPPARPAAEPYKTHLAYVKERRSQADGEAMLAEALARLRDARSPRPPMPPVRLASGVVASEGQPDHAGSRQASGGDPRAPVTAESPAVGAGSPGGDAEDLPRPPGRRSGAGRQAAGVRRGRPQPGQREGEGPRAAQRAPGPRRAGGDLDMPGADTSVPVQAQAQAQPAPGPAGEPAGMPPGRTDPAPPGPPADEWCGGCGYMLTAPGHAEHVRAQRLRATQRPHRARPGAARRGR